MNWQEHSLDELGTVSRGRSRHRPRDAEHLYGGPYPFVQTGDVKKAALYLKDYTQTYSEAGLQQSRLWPKGTLCITIAANIAETAILDIDACFPDSVIGFTADPEKADTKFIKYQFDALLAKRMRTVSQGAAQDNLSQSKLLSFKFPAPELRQQERISAVLSDYDDLIENNRRRIELLNQTVRLVYHEWFVRCQFPGYDHSTKVGGAPKGWKVTTLSEIAETNPESFRKGALPEEISYVDIASVDTGQIKNKTSMLAEDAPGRARRIARHGDVIWSNVRPNLRAYALVQNPGKNDVFSTGFTILRPKGVPPSFLYCTVTTDSFVGHLVNRATGASYPAVRPDDFEAAKVLVPSPEYLKAFDRFSEPFLSQIALLSDSSRALSEARDLLLPRLMDGGLEV